VRSLLGSDRLVGFLVAQAALRFASARHAQQYREIDGAPFIVHPIEVACLLDRAGRPDEVIAAGLLHDTLEKTATTGAELQGRFGTRVARLVASVSDDPSISDYEQRKHQLRDRVARDETDTIAIFAADKVSKVRELALGPPGRPHDFSCRARLTHYRATFEMLRRAAPELALVDLLGVELDRLAALPRGAAARN
jgi:(p)ppGpp synthase/HD superfamily hydrolase